MGSPRPVLCPSGLRGEVRGFKTKEANMLADQAAVRRGTTFDAVLSSCWLSTDDPGIYTLGKDGRLDWSKVLIADRFFALVEVRIATYGPDYEFTLQCDERTCRERFPWVVDLAQLPRKSIPQATLDALRGGENKFPVDLPSVGRRVWFRLLDGAAERAAAEHAKKNRAALMTTALASRVVAIDGVHANDKRRWLDELEMGDAQALIEAMDEHDGGIETALQVECPSCFNAMEVDLPLDRDFFLPAPKKKARAATTEAAD